MTETQTQLDLVSLIPEWLREAESFDEQSRVLREKAQALRQMVDSVRVLNGDAGRLLTLAAPEQTGLDSGVPAMVRRTNRFDPKDGPRGRDAVRSIVSERPGIWTLRGIREASVQKGWPSSGDALATAVHRLQQDGEAEWIKKGTYRFPPQRLEPSVLVTDDGS